MTPGEYLVKRLTAEQVLNIRVKVTREFRFRVWLARKLFLLAGRILGGRVEVDVG
jgi:hypothetical protein